MSKRNIEAVYPLSPMQQGMLFHSLYAPGSGVYVEQVNCDMRGGLDVTTFERAWRRVLARHPVLRTSFAWKSLDKTLQVVHRQVALPLEQHDWRGLSQVEQETRLGTFLREDRRQGFDLARAPLMRLALIRTADDAYRFLWSHHHILLDGWSWPLLLMELFTFYEAFRQDRDLHLERPRPYQDYIAWLQQQDLTKSESFWRRTLDGFFTPTPLGVGRPLEGVADLEAQYGEQEIQLSAEAMATLQSMAQRHGLTLNTLVQGAWALLLSHYSGEEDVVFGAAVSGRPVDLPGVEAMIGLFINTLPVRARIPSETSVVEWLRELQDQSVEMRQYEYSPLVQVQGWSEVPQGQSLFESILVFENYPVNASLGERVGCLDLEIQDVRHISQTNYPLTVTLRVGETLPVKVWYDGRRFDADTIRRILTHLQTLLERMAADPGQPVSAVSLLTEAELRQLLMEWNDTTVDYAGDRCLHELFETQAERTPDAVAVVFPSAGSGRSEEQHLTYGELNRRANQLAHYLRGLGVGPDVLVGICMERSLEMVMGILGTLKAGGAYLPIDPKYPEERILFMLDDSGVSVLLTQEEVMERFSFTSLQNLRVGGVEPVATPPCSQVQDFDGLSKPDRTLGDSVPRQQAEGAERTVLLLDRIGDVIACEETDNPRNVSQATGLAYVMYTSGSTGRPKGVAMPHRPLVNLMHWQGDATTLDRPARTLQFASLGFDVSCQEIFFTWSSGGTLILVSEDTRRDTPALVEFLDRAAVERLFLPFVTLQHLAQVTDSQMAAVPTKLREVITAGEQLQITPQIERFFGDLGECTLHNQYGPTEGHVVTAYTLRGAPDEWMALPPIGRPIANAAIFILDRNLRPVPVGVPGELYIGGVSLARGYVNRPRLTADKFVPNPFPSSVPSARGGDAPPLSPPLGGMKGGARLYRTGDLCRYLPDGNIEFLGRMDHQVKVRGYRIELREIEVLLAQHPVVQEAVVLAREDKPGDSSTGLRAGKRLVAYVISGDGHEPSVGEMRSFLLKKLPDYMVPSAFVTLEMLPLTPNGKVDRRALPLPERADFDLGGVLVAPRDNLELRLVQIWEDVLGVQPVGVTHDFFELGGHSLLAVRLMARIQRELGQQLPLATLFHGATVGHLATTLRQHEGVAGLSSSLVPMQAGHPHKRPLFFAHSGGGGVFCYADLSRCLGPDQPFYGLQSQGLDGEKEPYTQVETMASHYVQLVQTVQPEGPYLLGGWCFGGLVAFEMAQQLHTQGQEVALLALVNTESSQPDSQEPEDEVSLLASLALALGLSLHRITFESDRFEQLEPGERLGYALEQAKRAQVVPPDLELAQVRRLLHVFKSNLQAQRSYVPDAYPGSLMLFEASEQPVEETEWRALATGGLTVHRVPGNHYTVVREPNVKVLAEQLKHHLRTVETAERSE